MKKMITRRNFLKAAGVSAAALGLAACGGSSSSTASSVASSTAASSTAAKADGKVYYLNFKPEQDQAWQDLAKVYTEETGVPVTVVTAASGQYETTLMSEMEKSEAPTLFQVNGPVGLANWKDYCYDLSGSQVYGELTSDSFALKDGDAVTSIAYVIETYGIIYNKELLTAAGYKQEDIKGFADLKKVADDIQARKAELGVDGAFTSAGMDSSSDWRFKTHLANLPIYYEYKADGKVYYLNFKPEQDQAWQDLAKAYTEETGVPVTVVTAASGQYETTLMSEMEKSEAPTLFQVNGPVGLANWKDYCYDLSGSQVYGELTSDSFALKDGDAVTSIAYVIETYGIIYNKELLTAAGYKQEDIKGFADLKKVADDIQARKAELGVDGAFTSAGMDGSSDWRFKTHLANLPIYYEYKADGISSTDAIKGLSLIHISEPTRRG